MDSATDNTESSVHETHVRELQAPEAYKERTISIIIRTLCGLRNESSHRNLSQRRAPSLQWTDTYALLSMVMTSHLCSVLNGDNILNELYSFQMYRRMI